MTLTFIFRRRNLEVNSALLVIWNVKLIIVFLHLSQVFPRSNSNKVHKDHKDHRNSAL